MLTELFCCSFLLLIRLDISFLSLSQLGIPVASCVLCIIYILKSDQGRRTGGFVTAIYGPSDMWRAATGSKLKYWPSNRESSVCEG